MIRGWILALAGLMMVASGAHALDMHALSHVHATTSPTNLFLRGGFEKPASAPSSTLSWRSYFFAPGKKDALKKPGFIAARFETIARQAFANVDLDKSGSVDLDEAQALVLAMYIQINRQAPIDPPPRHVVERLFKAADKDKSGHLSVEEFIPMATILCARAALRICVFKFMFVVCAPLLANHIVTLFRGGKPFAAAALFANVIPKRFHEAVLNRHFARLILTIAFCGSLGNVVLKTLDAFLGYNANRKGLGESVFDAKKNPVKKKWL